MIIKQKLKMFKLFSKIGKLQRNKVKRLQIFAFLAIILSFFAVILGGAVYALIGIPCVSNKPVQNIERSIFDGLEAQKFRPALDPCQVFANFLLPLATLITSTIGLIAAFLNRKNFYQTFGLLSFIAIILQLVGFAGSLSVIIDHSDELDRTVESLAVIFTALNGVTLILVIFNLNSAMYIYTAFLKQGREVFEEQRRLEFENRKSKKGEFAIATVQLANLFGAFAPNLDLKV